MTPGYFEAMGVKLIRGRFFSESDRAETPRVIIVDEKLAERFWPAQDPIGRRMYFPTDINELVAINKDTVFLTVVGVVRDLKLQDLTEGEKVVGSLLRPRRPVRVALPHLHGQDGRRRGPPSRASSGAPSRPATASSPLRRRDHGGAHAEVAPEPPVSRDALASFGVVALLLSAVGIYGVLAYLVTQRKREIGIRIALGSSARGIFDLVIREGVLLVGLGFAVGALGAFLLRRSLESQLFGVRTADPWVLGGVTALLALVALLACALPARRATRIDPRVVLAE